MHEFSKCSNLLTALHGSSQKLGNVQSKQFHFPRQCKNKNSYETPWSQWNISSNVFRCQRHGISWPQALAGPAEAGTPKKNETNAFASGPVPKVLKKLHILVDAFSNQLRSSIFRSRPRWGQCLALPFCPLFWTFWNYHDPGKNASYWQEKLPPRVKKHKFPVSSGAKKLNRGHCPAGAGAKKFFPLNSEMDVKRLQMLHTAEGLLLAPPGIKVSSVLSIFLC